MSPEANEAGPTSPESASDFARSWVEEAIRGSDDTARLASVEHVLACVNDDLSRLFGSFGSLALVNRALARAQRDHASLEGVTVSSAPPPLLLGAAERSQTQGVLATADGIVAVLLTLTELVARLVGDDLALMLLQQCRSGRARSDTPATRQQAHHPVEKQ